MRKTCLIFVFGTLKRGFPNFEFNQGEFMADDFVTVDRYPLYLVEDRNMPWLMDEPGLGEQVAGEIFRVDMGQLDALDALERVSASDGYRRKRVLVVDKNEMELAVEIYLKPVTQLKGVEVRGGPFASYSFAQAELYQRRPSIINR